MMARTKTGEGNKFDIIAGTRRGYKVDIMPGTKTGTQGGHDSGHQDRGHKVKMMSGTILETPR